MISFVKEKSGEELRGVGCKLAAAGATAARSPAHLYPNPHWQRRIQVTWSNTLSAGEANRWPAAGTWGRARDSPVALRARRAVPVHG